MMTGPLIAETRRSFGMSQSALAKALGISPSYLCDMELGRRDFPDARVPDLPAQIRAVVARAMIEARRRDIETLSQYVESAAA